MRVIAALTILILAVGCGGAGGAPPPASDPGPFVDPDPPASASGEFNVTITTKTGLVYVDKLELEFNRRRGFHAFYGFHEDRFDKLATVPWDGLERVEIVGPMSQPLYDQATFGREDQNLRRDQMFETRLIYKDRTAAVFYAIIAKLRGEKDFQLWELGMTGNAAQVEYIEFNR